MGGGGKITLYLDVVSPFAYMAYYMLRHSPAFDPVTITYVPVFLGGIMQTTGNRPPLAIKNKSKWIELERKRWASLFHIPLASGAPDNFPINTLPVQRALTAIQSRYPADFCRAVDAFFEAIWGPARNEIQAHDPKTGLVKMLAQALEEEKAKAIVEMTGTDEVKGRLMANTSVALDSGAFGLPWYQCENEKGEKECFWGLDHLAQVVEFLGLEREKLGKGARAML